MKRRWLAAFAVAFVLSVSAEFLLPGSEGHNGFWWSHIWGFFALFGFVCCVVIVVTSKLVGHYWLQRREDYYE